MISRYIKGTYMNKYKHLDTFKTSLCKYFIELEYISHLNNINHVMRATKPYYLKFVSQIRNGDNEKNHIS